MFVDSSLANLQLEILIRSLEHLLNMILKRELIWWSRCSTYEDSYKLTYILERPLEGFVDGDPIISLRTDLKIFERSRKRKENISILAHAFE